jgi:DNA repair protein RadC
MSQLSFSSFDDALLVCDTQGCYHLASADQILEATHQVIDQKMQRCTEFVVSSV